MIMMFINHQHVYLHRRTNIFKVDTVVGGHSHWTGERCRVHSQYTWHYDISLLQTQPVLWWPTNPTEAKLSACYLYEGEGEGEEDPLVHWWRTFAHTWTRCSMATSKKKSYAHARVVYAQMTLNKSLGNAIGYIIRHVSLKKLRIENRMQVDACSLH